MNNIHLTHIPVLKEEAIASLNIKQNGIYIDCTFGCGGHSKEILKNLNQNGKLYAIDKDPFSINVASEIQDHRFYFISDNFSNALQYFQETHITKKVDGILLDLGVSSIQISNSNRGFSFLLNGPLDMRMNPKIGITASQWLMRANIKSITNVLYEFGEERFAKRIANQIVRQRKIKPIVKTLALADLIKNIVPRRNKHPATRTFQAIRMYINQELIELKKVLKYALTLLNSGGRLVIISFHSLEDRIVKKFFIKNSNTPLIPMGIAINEIQLKNLKKTKLKIINKIIPTKNEIKKNLKSRSAILRTSEKT